MMEEVERGEGNRLERNLDKRKGIKTRTQRPSKQRTFWNHSKDVPPFGESTNTHVTMSFASLECW